MGWRTNKKSRIFRKRREKAGKKEPVKVLKRRERGSSQPVRLRVKRAKIPRATRIPYFTHFRF